MKKLIAICSLIVAMVALTACGGNSSESAKPSETPAASNSQSVSATEDKGDPNYQFRTSDTERIVTEGEINKEKFAAPVLVTSIGQSADVSMLDALLKKVGAEYTYNATATAADIAAAKTVIIASGASTKGLGAAGISTEDELKRAAEIAKAVSDNGVSVVMAHLGGVQRRGPLSDQFNDIVLDCASYIIVVEEANDDNKFSDVAKEKNIPITYIKSIADAKTPLEELFAAK